jgi:HEAT repeat protein
MVAKKTSQVRKMFGMHAGSRQTALMRVLFCMALCALIGGLAPLAAAAPRDTGVPQRADTAVSAALDAQPVTYRYNSLPNGASQVQRSIDGGSTWSNGGVVPEPVLQLASSPVNNTVVFARTDANLWHSETGGASWARVASLPGRPLALAMTGHSDPSGLIFLGTDTQGLFTSMDSGRTWQAAGGRMSPVGAGALAISALAVSPGDEQVVYAASTFSMATPQGLHSLQRVFISVDDGRLWFEMTPAPRVDQPITGLTPLVGPLLAVLIPSQFGTQWVGLEVGPGFAAGLYDPDPGMRAATARALDFSHDPSLLPVLLTHLSDPDLLAGDQVAQAIGRLGNAAAVPLLIPILSDADGAIRARAATALGLLHAEEAIPQLSTMLQNDGPWTTRYAAEALAAIGTPAAMAALTAPLADQGMTPARYAAMGALETAGQPAVTAMVAALNDSSAVVRANAAEMLGWLKPVEDTPQRAGAVADLTRLFSDRDPAVQTQAAWALGELGAEPASLALLPVPNIPAPNPAPILAPVAARPAALSPLAALPDALPDALADVRADNPTLAAMATLLVLVLLAMLTVVLTRKSPRPASHLGHA